MGNMNITLPPDPVNSITNKTNGIPAASTQPESGSVLEIESEIAGLPRNHTDSSTYVKTRPEKSRSGVHSLMVLPAYGKTNDNDVGKHSDVDEPSNHRLSWAEIVIGRKKE